jgi:TonB family protein
MPLVCRGMGLRGLLFSSDGATSESICPVLADLGVEAEYCDAAGTAIERVTSEPFQIVILDWDNQPESAQLLRTARERKASERPLTLAIVADDASVPQALRAGVNSILRRPLLTSQVKDTLTTARDLLRAKQESAASAALVASAVAAAASATASTPASMEPGNEKLLRAGEFLQSSGPAPGAQFDTEASGETSLELPPQPVDPLRDLESIAAAPATEEESAQPAPPAPSEPRGLAWYMNARAGTLPKIPPQVLQAAAAAPPAPPARAELLGYDQNPASNSGENTSSNSTENWAPTGKLPSARSVPSISAPSAFASETSAPNQERDKKTEAELFAYISGVGGETEQEEGKPPSRLGKRAIVGALALACCAIVIAPQAPWHPAVLKAWAGTQRATHAWLNPQLQTKTAAAPAAHEDFGRAGDEYKLPVAENIPDATTDPSQIRIVPVVDPTAKKPGDGGEAPAAGQVQGSAADAAQASGISVQEKAEESPSQPPAIAADAPSGAASGGGTSAPTAAEPHREAAVVSPPPVATPQSSQPKTIPQPQYVSAPTHPAIPSSMRSQMASMTPEASGNKSPESAMPSIEPVVLTESASRALITDQPDLVYPASANGQQGKVVLQVLIGRDGSVEDAKFMQGSLAFARAAIDNVKLWRFKPYLMNGRAVSVQTPITVTFKPTS